MLTFDYIGMGDFTKLKRDHIIYEQPLILADKWMKLG